VTNLVSFLLLTGCVSAACNSGALLSSTDQQEPEAPGLIVCIVGDTMPHYFHGDFNHDGVADSSRITLYRCF
jgi:hypothetical protein